MSRAARVCAIVAILFLGACLRGCGLQHGLDLHDPALAISGNAVDEETQAAAIRSGSLIGNHDPGGFWNWGAAGFNVFGAFDRIALPTIGLWFEAPTTAKDLEHNLSAILLSHRCLGVLAALLAIMMFSRTALREFGDAIGIAVTLLFATAYLGVREAHYGKVDEFQLLGVTVVLDHALRLSRSDCRWLVLRAGFLAGAFAAFKYSAALLCGFVAVGIWVRSSGHELSSSRKMQHLCLAAMASVLGYLALSPNLFWYFDGMRSGLAAQRTAIGFEWGRLWEMVSYHSSESVFVGFGEILALLALIGVGCVALRRSSGASRGLWLCLLVASSAFPLSNTSHSVRQALPLLPAACVFAGLGLRAIVGPRLVPLLVLSLVVSAPSLVRGMTLGSLLRQPDTRRDGLQFLSRAQTPAQQILGVGFYGLPRRSAIFAAYPFLDWMIATRLGKLDANTLWNGLQPKYVIRDLTPGIDLSAEWQRFESEIATRYVEVLRVDGRKAGVDLELPDLIHGTPFHCIPYRSPWQMDRPGPAFVIYSRREESPK